jgi:dihydroorotate dehydrogenase
MFFNLTESLTKLMPFHDQPSFYDPHLSYEENYARGPFGIFTDKNPAPRPSDPPAESFLGIRLHKSFGIAAGPLLNSRYVIAALDWGYDIAVYKTVRSRAQASLPFPNVLDVDIAGDLRPGDVVRAASGDRPVHSITNSFGVPSAGPEVWQPDMARAAKAAREGQLVIGSFQGTGKREEQIRDYALTAGLVAETGVPVIEANLSCPNEDTADLLCFAVDKVAAVVDGIKRAVPDKPLLLKLAYFSDHAQLERLVRAVGDRIEGFAAINTLPARVVDSSGRPALGDREVSGVCGQAIRWAGFDMTRRLLDLRERLRLGYAVAAGGGVLTPADYAAYRRLGADAVMTATGAMLDPLLAMKIREAALNQG